MGKKDFFDKREETHRSRPASSAVELRIFKKDLHGGTFPTSYSSSAWSIVPVKALGSYLQILMFCPVAS